MIIITPDSIKDKRFICISNKQINLIVSSLIALGFVKKRKANFLVKRLHELNIESVDKRKDVYFFDCKIKPLTKGVQLIQLLKLVSSYLYSTSDFYNKKNKNITQMLKKYFHLIRLRYVSFLKLNGYVDYTEYHHQVLPFYSHFRWVLNDYDNPIYDEDGSYIHRDYEI